MREKMFYDNNIDRCFVIWYNRKKYLRNNQMNIGNVKTKNNYFLAPMAGITDKTFRSICADMGAGLTYSEMVSAKGLYYKDKKTKILLERAEGEYPYAVQIFGSEPDIIAAVAKEAASYGDILDLNMGCPMPKIVNNGDGSALLKNLRLMGEVMYSAAENAGVPVTAKIRIGWDENNINAVSAAKVLEENGACAITVHGRTREQFYSGSANPDIIKKVKEAVSIPVIGNGDIGSPSDAAAMLNLTGCDAVMIGRAARGNPFIFRQLAENRDINISHQEIISTAVRHIKMLCEDKGEYCGVREARKHISWYIKGMKNSSAVKTAVFKCTKLNELTDILESFVK